MRRIPIVYNDYDFGRMLRALVLNKKAVNFSLELKNYLQVDDILLTSSGFASLYVILRTLKDEKPGRSEVIIPAYTAPAMALLINKIGLKIKLCDMSLETFNVDTDKIPKMLNEQTLAVIIPHLFGIPADIERVIKAAGKEIAVIDDCAQSFGSELKGVKCGALSDIGFGSFNRGKNFSLCSGGFISMKGCGLRKKILSNYYLLKEMGFLEQCKNAAANIVFSFLAMPGIYYMAFKPLAFVKSSKEQRKFNLKKMGKYSENIAAKLFNIWKDGSAKRAENAEFLRKELGKISGLKIPENCENSKPVYCRFPFIINDNKKKRLVMDGLNKENIDSSEFYRKPVHKLWDFDFITGELKNAEIFAEHLLTLPVHGNTKRSDLEKMVYIIKQMLL